MLAAEIAHRLQPIPSRKTSPACWTKVAELSLKLVNLNIGLHRLGPDGLLLGRLCSFTSLDVGDCDYSIRALCRWIRS